LYPLEIGKIGTFLVKNSGATNFCGKFGVSGGGEAMLWCRDGTVGGAIK
jgi:hypothetical protein